MRIAVTGASGNIGSSLLETCEGNTEIEDIVAISRRRPAWDVPRTRWVEADVLDADLERYFEGVDAVVHLAWAIQPSHDLRFLERTNVEGSHRVFEAAAAAGAEKVVYASSVGAYSAGPIDRRVDENWPTDGIPGSSYSRYKAAVETELDQFEQDHPEVAVVRFRPGLIFKKEAATGIRRLFAGPLLPTVLLKENLLPRAPFLKGLRFQAVHSHDVGEAFLAGLTRDVSGPFNLAADPVIGPDQISEVLGAEAIEGPSRLARALAGATWRARLQPSEPGWLDLAMESPLMSSDRARDELAWEPRLSSTDALAELLEGLRQGTGHSPPHLARSGVVARIDEFRTGVGGRQWARSRAGQIRKYLEDAHSIEKQALIQMRFAPRIAGHPDLAKPFREHETETGDHESLVQERLVELDSGTSGIKDRAGTLGGLGMLLFARSQPDAPGKLVAHGYSYEHMELAAYEILTAYAERSGDLDTAALARRIADQERSMATRLATHFDLAVELSTSEPAEDTLAEYLRDADGIEAQGEALFSGTKSFTDDRHLTEMLGEAAGLVVRHRAGIAGELRSLGTGTSTLKKSALAAGGHGMSAFLRLQPDPNTKVAGFVYAYLHLQVASYELLARFAANTGNSQAADMASTFSGESRDMAGRLTELWGHLGGV